MSASLRTTRGLALALGVAVSIGCAWSSRSPEHPESTVPDRSATIIVGQTERFAVKEVLGRPLYSSAQLGFDLFRTTTEQVEIAYAVTPWPIPFARLKDEIHRYSLVAYAADGRVSALASGLFRKPADWRNVSPIERDFSALHLRAGDFMFFVDPEGARAENLLAAPDGRDRLLAQDRGSSRCTVVLGCGAGGCPDQVAVDGSAARRLPLRTANAYWFEPQVRAAWLEGIETAANGMAEPWLEALVALDLASGSHALAFSSAHLDGAAASTLDCRAGTLTYLVVSAKFETGFMRPGLVEWRFETNAAMPARFARRPLVLMDGGEWYLGAGQ